MKKLIWVAMLLILNIPLTTLALTAPDHKTGSELTPELRQKILKLIEKRGDDGEIPARFANALGVSSTGKPWPNHHANAIDTNKPDTVHIFSVSRINDQDVVLTKRFPDGLNAYRVNQDGKVVTALSYKLQTKELTMRIPVEAQSDLDVEIVFWKDTVDELISGLKNKHK